MTAQRQERNGFGRQIALIGLVAAIGFFLGFFLAPAVRATTTERVVAARFSGLAIDGFDPVAYFVQNQAVLGLPDYEASEAGAVWRFRNEGNRAAFLDDPDVYAPHFGGYDPVAIARGVAVPGNPRLDRKSTRLNSSHRSLSRMPSSA